MFNLWKCVFLLGMQIMVAYSAPIDDSSHLDVVFVLDGSSSLRYANFEKVQDLVTSIVGNLNLNKTNIGVIQYSSAYKTFTEIPLGPHKSQEDFAAKVAAIKYRQGLTYTSAGLVKAFEEFNTRGRKNVRKVAVVITDGKANDAAGLLGVSEDLKDTGVTTFAVGIGDEIIDAQLNVIANQSPNEQAGTWRTYFDSMNQIVPEISGAIINRSLLQSQPIDHREKDNSGVDVIFVLDGSRSIRNINFERIKNWVKSVVYKVDLDNVHVGVVQYSDRDKAVTEIALSKQSSFNSFSKAIGNIQYQRGGTHTANALRKTLLDFEQYGRKDACKMVMILTDGQSTDRRDLGDMAAALRIANIKPIAVGVGTANRLELKLITGEEKGVVMLQDFITIKNVATSISNAISDCTQNIAGLADLFFLLDGSGSIKPNEFETVKEWVKTLTKSISIDDGHVNVGVIQYAHWYSNVPMVQQKNMRTEVPLNSQSFDSFSEKVDNITHIGDGTSTGHALAKLLYDFEKYGRGGVCKFAIVLTDGRANDPKDIAFNVKALEEEHVTRLVVGVGRVNVLELEEIASETTNGEKAVFTLQSFDEIFETIAFFSANFVCGGHHLTGEYRDDHDDDHDH